MSGPRRRKAPARPAPVPSAAAGRRLLGSRRCRRRRRRGDHPAPRSDGDDPVVGPAAASGRRDARRAVLRHGVRQGRQPRRGPGRIGRPPRHLRRRRLVRTGVSGGRGRHRHAGTQPAPNWRECGGCGPPPPRRYELPPNWRECGGPWAGTATPVRSPVRSGGALVSRSWRGTRAPTTPRSIPRRRPRRRA